MARYGLGVYNAVLYGQLDINKVIYDSQLTAQQIDYRTTLLTWTKINIRLEDDPLTHWKIVKTTNGAPDNPDDGIVVTGGILRVGGVSSGDPTDEFNPLRFTDLDEYFPGGIEVTYSYWVFNGLDWYYCGSADTILVEDDNDSIFKMMSTLPGAWTNSSRGIGDATGGPELPAKPDKSDSSDLWDFLSGFGFYYDKLRSQTKAIGKLSDYRYYPHKLLPTAMDMLGFTYEPTLGDSYHKALYHSGHLINSLKGSKAGLAIYATSLTHYPANVLNGTNLMLDYNNSSFEESVGSWVVTSDDSIASHKYADAVSDIGYSLTTPTSLMPFTTETYPRQAGYGLITSAGTGTISLNSYDTTHAITMGIPVKAGTPYHFCGYVRGHDSNNYSPAATIHARITWFDRYGTSLTSTSYGTSVTVSNAWKYFESTTTNSEIYAPSGAVYAGIDVQILSPHSGDKFFLDMLNFCVFPGLDNNPNYAATEKIFEDSRTAILEMDGVRTNLIVNPGFDTSVGGWVPKNGQLLQDFSTYLLGTTSGRFTASGTDGAVTSTWMEVIPSTPYTFSVYLKGPASGSSAKVRLEFSAPETAADQTALLYDSGTGEYYFSTANHMATSSSVTVGNTSFTRLSVTATSPEYSEDTGALLAKVSVIPDSTATNDNWWIDCALLETGDTALPFFQGGGGLPDTDVVNQSFYAVSDCRWESRIRANLYPEGADPEFIALTGATTVTNHLTTTTPAPKFGTTVTKVTNSATGGGAKTSTVVPYRTYSSTGDPIVAGGTALATSVYVYGPAATYTVSVLLDNNVVGTTSFTTTDTANWNRLHVIGHAKKTYSSPVFWEIRVTSSLSSGDWYLDGVQMEYGEYPTPFIGLSAYDQTTPHPQYPLSNIWVTTAQSIGGGQSYYWPRLDNKFPRLEDTINTMIPLGSTSAVKWGRQTYFVGELTSSLLRDASFENNLIGWSAGSGSELKRSVGRGSIFSEVGALSGSWLWCKNAYQENVPVYPLSRYYLSAAVAIPDVAYAGVITITVDWQDSSKTLISSTSITTTVASAGRWVYIGDNISSPAEAAYAKVTLSHPTSEIYFDRVIFRKI